jgi:hypothetical protein
VLKTEYKLKIVTADFAKDSENPSPPEGMANMHDAQGNRDNIKYTWNYK